MTDAHVFLILLFAVYYSFPGENFFFLLLKSFMYFSQEYSLDYFLHLKEYEEVMLFHLLKDCIAMDVETELQFTS